MLLKNLKSKLGSLRVKLPLWQGLIVIIMVIVLFAFSFVLVDRYVVRQKLGDLMNLADAKYVHVLDMLDQGKNISHERAGSLGLTKALGGFETDPSPANVSKLQGQADKLKKDSRLERKHAFGRQPLTRERFHDVDITDKNGIIIVSAKRDEIGKDISKTEMWRFGRKKTVLINPFPDADGHVVFAFVSPIHAGEGHKGRFLGVLINKVDVGLLTMMMNADLGNITGGRLFFAGFKQRTMDIYIMNKRGQYITQSMKTEKDTVLKKKGSKLPLERGLDLGASGDRVTNIGMTTGAREAMDIYRNRDGIDVAGASMHLFDNGWTVVVEQDTQDAFASVINLERALVVGGIIAVFLAVFLSWLASRKISASIEELDLAAVTMASGERVPQLTKRTGEYREISSLYSSFNIMSNNLAKSMSEIKASNEKLREVDKTSRRMIDDLLEFIRPSELTITETPVNEIVDEALSIVKTPEHIVLRREYESSNPKIEVDRMKIVLAVVNVLSKEVEAMPQGGTLTVTTAFDPQDKEYIEIRVSDTSAGVRIEEIPRLFEPTFATMVSEMALGMPIVKRYVLQHGGEVTASKGADAGLVITLKLPVKQTRKAA